MPKLPTKLITILIVSYVLIEWDSVHTKEDGTLLRSHGQIAAASIAVHRMTLGSFNQSIVNSPWRAKNITRSVRRERKDQNDDQDHDGMHIIREECSFNPSKHGVQNDANRQEEAGGSSRNTSERSHHSRATSQEHSSDEDVGHQAKSNIDTMRHRAVAGADDFQKGVCIWRFAFQFDRKSREQNDLDCRT